jgi:hypothetical protein
VRSLLDLRSFASGVCEFNSRKGTSSCAKAKLSLLVCILIFTTFPDPLVSAMAFTQQTLPLKQLYNLYSTYYPINIKQMYTRAEYVL